MVTDKEITEAVAGLRGIAELQAILFSNDEFFVVVDLDNYEKYYPKIKKILKGHKFSLHNLKETKEIKEVLRSCRFLYGSIDVSQLNFKPYILVSYDLTKLKSSQKVKISKAIYGHSLSMKGKKYEYKGLKDQDGFELVSKSTMLVEQEKFPMFKHFLDENKVTYTSKEVWI